MHQNHVVRLSRLLQEVLIPLVVTINEETDGASFSLDHLARWVARDWLSLDVAQVQQVLVEVNVAVLVLVVRLDTPEIGVRAFLKGGAELGRQICVELILHLLSKESRELSQGLVEATILFHPQVVEVVPNVQLLVFDFHPEFFLVDVRQRVQSEGHVGQNKLAHAPLLDHLIRFHLEPLVKLEDHRYSSQLDRQVEVLHAVMSIFRRPTASEIDCEV